MYKLLLIAAGGAAGALLRYAVSGWVQQQLGASFPWGTLAANLIGCFMIGFLWAWAERALFSPEVSAFIFIGVIGAFTTFSTYSLETLNLLRDGEAFLAAGNVLVSTAFGLLCVFGGLAAFRLLLSLLR